MASTTINFIDPYTGRRRRGVKVVRKTPIGEPGNPVQIDNIPADQLIDRNVVLRVDSPAGHTWQTLQSDRHLRIVLASKRVTLAVVRKDRIASPEPAPDTTMDMPGSTQLARKRVRMPGEGWTNNGESVVYDSLESDDWETTLEREDVQLPLPNFDNPTIRVSQATEVIYSMICTALLATMLPKSKPFVAVREWFGVVVLCESTKHGFVPVKRFDGESAWRKATIEANRING